MGLVIVTGSKSTSGLSSLFTKAKKLFVPLQSLKDLWRTSRGVIDTIAQSVGVPLQQVRQGLRNQGVDPDKYESAMSSFWASNPPENSTAEEVQQQFDVAEDVAKQSIPPTVWLALGAGLLLITVFSNKRRIGGWGRRAGRSFRRYRLRRRRR